MISALDPTKMATCQPFQAGEQQEQHLHQDYAIYALPSRYGRTVLPPSAAPEPPSSSGRSATEARALKIHSEAERRRRERINAHLAALRRLLIPDTKQVDKATLLARVVSQLKDLKRKASEAAQPTTIPAEANGLTVDCYAGDERTMYVRASISCDDRPGLLADLAAAFRGLRLRPLRADMASLGSRAQCDFMLCREEGDMGSAGVRALQEVVRQALAQAAFSEMVHGYSSSRSKRQKVLESHFGLGHGLLNSM